MFEINLQLEESSVFRHENDRKVRTLDTNEISDKEEEEEFNDVQEIDDEKTEIDSISLTIKDNLDLEDEKNNDFAFPDTSFKLEIASDLK